MSIETHRHCQATVLGATGEPPEHGLTWPTIRNLDLGDIDPNWLDYFVNNVNVTEDLAGILKLLKRLVGNFKQSGPLPGDIINIGSDDRTVNVRNNISTGYSGVVGITSGNQQNRMLKACPIRVENTNEDGPVIATLWVGDQSFAIRALKVQEPEPEDRYIITEDEVYDIVLSGGDNDGDPLDYTDVPERYVVTENGYEYDIGVSGYGDSALLNYNED